jgi:hypothetical protein
MFPEKTFEGSFLHPSRTSWSQDFPFVEISFRYLERLSILGFQADQMEWNLITFLTLRTMEGLGVPGLPEILLVCKIFKC